jgi:hypothetical protein
MTRAQQSAWSRFLGWHRDEKFWRDVYARAISTAAIALIAFGAAAIGGYVKVNPEVAYIPGPFIALFCGGASVTKLDGPLTDRYIRSSNFRYLIQWLFLLAICLAIMMAVAFAWVFAVALIVGRS